MGDLGQIVIPILIAGLVLFFSWMAHGADHERIREQIEEKGGEVLEIKWRPFGPGWFGSRERIYEVSYTTRNGQVHTATCKTSMFSGVYWLDPDGSFERANDRRS